MFYHFVAEEGMGIFIFNIIPCKGFFRLQIVSQVMDDLHLILTDVYILYPSPPIFLSHTRDHHD